MGLGGDGFEGFPVDDGVAFGTVEVNEVEVLKAVCFEAFGEVERIVAINGLLLVVALGKAYAFAVYEVYGGNEVHFF